MILCVSTDVVCFILVSNFRKVPYRPVFLHTVRCLCSPAPFTQKAANNLYIPTANTSKRQLSSSHYAGTSCTLGTEDKPTTV